jgi:hypothetical protein
MTTTLRKLPRTEWDELASQFDDLSYRQCGSYAELAAKNVGAKCEFVGVFEGDGIIGLANVRIKTIPLLPLGIAYVNYGPLTARQGEFTADHFGRSLAAIAQEYVYRRRLMLRVVPPLSGGQWLSEQASCFDLHSFFPSKQQKPAETFILDLSKPLEEIRKKLDGKWRSDLSKAERSNLRITKASSPSAFDSFEPLFLELVEQKNFSAPQDVAFFREVQKKAEAYEQLVLHLAWHEDKVIAGHLGSFVGDTATYLLGAANSKGRDLRASFLLQWAVIQYAQSIGKTFYDLGGINLQANPNVHRFKQRLNGRHVAEIGPYELAPSTFRCAVLGFVEQIYSRQILLRSIFKRQHMRPL